MLYFLLKAAISGLLIALISEIARRAPGWGGVLASLPLTSVLAMIWLWRDTGDEQRVAELATSTFWFFLPSVPLFLVLPVLLKHGLNFWAAMIVVVTGTLLLYSAAYWAAPRMGIRL